MKENEFDLDFDFEKEYGFDLPSEDEKTEKLDEDFDLRAILESDFAEEAELFNAEYQNDFDYDPEEYPLEEEAAPAAEVPAEEDPEVDFSFDDEDLIDMSHRSIEQMMEEDDVPVMDELAEEEIPAPAVEDEEPEAPVRQRRERKSAKERWNPLKQRPAPEAQEPKPESSNPRRKPVSRSRQFKNESFPLLIIGIAAVLI